MTDEHQRDNKFAKEEILDLNEKVKWFKDNAKMVGEYQEVITR